jgi:hypothetical protein
VGLGRTGSPRANRRTIALALTALIALLVAGGADAAKRKHKRLPLPAQNPSLYTGPGHRPGPDLLYAKAAESPQLQNAGPWLAAPILVSGAEAYRRGEFLYQDFLYDDHGAAGTAQDPQDPRGAGGDTFSRPGGTYTYPGDPAYVDNLADLVEFRVKPLVGKKLRKKKGAKGRTAAKRRKKRRVTGTAFRLTYNSMTDPALVGATIAIGSSPAPVQYPHGANASGPASLFLTVHGSQADLLRADGSPVTPAPKVDVNVPRRQVQVIVPKQAWDPGTHEVRVSVGVGLWDRGADRYLIPQGSRTATTPGGAGSVARPPAFFNVGFRLSEPMPQNSDAAGTAQAPAWWRDKQQGAALAQGDMSPFFAEVDFAKLRQRKNDDSLVPSRGAFDRILVSHHEPAQGVDYSGACIASGLLQSQTGCIGEYRGRLQPYAIYVPPGPEPKGGWGMTLLLHSLAAQYNQYLGSRNQRQFAERGGAGSIVITPEARGPDGGYLGYAAADTFEAWADAASHYRLDPAWTVTTGYSMGGIGTYRLAEEYPDLFAKAQPTVGSETTTYRLASLRNIPILAWNGLTDELQPPPFYLPDQQMLDQLGYRYEFDVFVPGEHLSLAINDQFAPAAQFLGTDRVDRNPFHVTYVVDPALHEPNLGMVADHAYWLSELVTRGSGHGTIDAVSAGFGQADPAVGPTQHGAGGLAGGSFLDPYPFTSQSRSWGPPQSAPKANRISITAVNLSAATIDVGRAQVGCDVALDVHTDGPLTIHLVSSPAAKAKKKRHKGSKQAAAAKKRKKRQRTTGGCDRVLQAG